MCFILSKVILIASILLSKVKNPPQRYNKYLEYARISAIFGQKSPKMIQKERERKNPCHAGDRDEREGN